MDKQIIEDFKTHEKWTKEISATNDFILKEMEKELKLALLNLKIEDARIAENTGIIPISLKIEGVVKTIHDRVIKLKREGREENNKAIQGIKSYIEKMENVKIEKSEDK